ncbi:hypothetical protein BESB_059900 [Besnoitia besnoiti]|uniref:Protein kinase domain-containing protein n=1 Tax=Besnoitia besnoiti TaxID=94643 RepID=A0A2A9MHH0_BESBE|nr:hypothetical protein BESB_059900 [Besnoitia besnoiti]PFH35103.1 hypothetical protein BESB_059900 [Besnoitia besnoiti]
MFPRSVYSHCVKRTVALFLFDVALPRLLAALPRLRACRGSAPPEELIFFLAFEICGLLRQVHQAGLLHCGISARTFLLHPARDFFLLCRGDAAALLGSPRRGRQLEGSAEGARGSAPILRVFQGFFPLTATLAFSKQSAFYVDLEEARPSTEPAPRLSSADPARRPPNHRLHASRSRSVGHSFHSYRNQRTYACPSSEGVSASSASSADVRLFCLPAFPHGHLRQTKKRHPLLPLGTHPPPCLVSGRDFSRCCDLQALHAGVVPLRRSFPQRLKPRKKRLSAADARPQGAKRGAPSELLETAIDAAHDCSLHGIPPVSLLHGGDLRGVARCMYTALFGVGMVESAEEESENALQPGLDTHARCSAAFKFEPEQGDETECLQRKEKAGHESQGERLGFGVRAGQLAGAGEEFDARRALQITLPFREKRASAHEAFWTSFFASLLGFETQLEKNPRARRVLRFVLRQHRQTIRKGDKNIGENVEKRPQSEACEGREPHTQLKQDGERACDSEQDGERSVEGRWEVDPRAQRRGPGMVAEPIEVSEDREGSKDSHERGHQRTEGRGPVDGAALYPQPLRRGGGLRSDAGLSVEDQEAEDSVRVLHEESRHLSLALLTLQRRRIAEVFARAPGVSEARCREEFASI